MGCDRMRQGFENPAADDPPSDRMASSADPARAVHEMRCRVTRVEERQGRRGRSWVASVDGLPGEPVPRTWTDAWTSDPFAADTLRQAADTRAVIRLTYTERPYGLRVEGCVLLTSQEGPVQ